MYSSIILIMKNKNHLPIPMTVVVQFPMILNYQSNSICL